MTRTGRSCSGTRTPCTAWPLTGRSEQGSNISERRKLGNAWGSELGLTTIHLISSILTVRFTIAVPRARDALVKTPCTAELCWFACFDRWKWHNKENLN